MAKENETVTRVGECFCITTYRLYSPGCQWEVRTAGDGKILRVGVASNEDVAFKAALRSLADVCTCTITEVLKHA